MGQLTRVAMVTRQLAKNTGAARNTHEHIRLFRALGAEIDVYAELIDKRKVKNSGGNPFAVKGWFLKGYPHRKYFNDRVLTKIAKKNYDLVIGHGDIIVQDVLFLHNCVHAAHEKIFDSLLADTDEMAKLHGELLSKKHFRLLIANSHLMQRDIEHRFAIDANNIEVVYPGYDPKQFNTDNKANLRQQRRQFLAISPDTILIGLVTSGDFKKRNVDFFIQAFAQLKKNKHDDVHALIVGSESRLKPYATLAASLGVADNITFLPPKPFVNEIYKVLDIAVLPAKWEEFGRVVLEAMASGLPVVVSQEVGSAEILEGNARNFIISLSHIETLISSLSLLVENKTLREQLGQINSITALKYTERVQAKKLMAILKQRDFV